AYRSGGSGYRSGSEQAEQVGLSAAHSGHSAYGGEQQPIYQRESACPPNFQGLVAYPHDCHRFVNCNGGSATIQTCSPGTLFNPKTLQCDHPTNVDCSAAGGGAVVPAETTRLGRLRQLDSDPKCPNGVNGLHPHPTDCTKFLNCANGHAFVQDCGPGTAFNPSLLVCVHKGTVNCGGAGGSGSSGHAYSAVSSEQLGCPPGTRGLHPHPHDPHKYLRCGIGVQPQVEQCPQGQIFDGFRLVCVYSGSAQTSYNPSPTSEHLSDLLCPHGADGQFVHPFDQTKFLLCKAAKLAVQSCEPGHVFSISRGTCQPKTQLVYTDYVSYVVSEISHELSMILSACPGGTDGLHLYPYDAGKYVRCSDGGKMSIISCGPQMAFSLSQRACRPSRQVINGDRVRFWEELTTTTTTYTYQDAQVHQSPLRECPPSLQGNYPYPFHAGHFVKCQNGLLQVVCCPSGSLYSLSKRECVARHLLSAHDYLDHAYISVQFSTDFMQDLTTLTCPPQAQGYYLHPFDCTKYLICRDQQTSIGSCDQGEVFSISQQKCVVRDKVTDAFDRVEYLSETQHELSQEADEEGEQGRNRGYPSNGAIALTGRYQRPDQATEYQIPPYSYPSPPIGGGQSPAKQYQPPPHSSAGYQPLSPVTGGYQQPQYSGGYQQNTQTSGASYYPGGVQPSAPPAPLMCPQRVSGLFPNPFDAMGYLTCIEGHTLVRQCLPLDVFSISRGYCLPEHLVVATDRIPFVKQQSEQEDRE
ncbi:hypothetical protein KR059_005797, partial [Drosophila kikkawai]